MKHIKEPQNIDLVVAPSVLTDAHRRAISNAITEYYKTGAVPVGNITKAKAIIQSTKTSENSRRKHLPKLGGLAK